MLQYYTVHMHEMYRQTQNKTYTKMIYAQWNGPSETKPNPENCLVCSYVCAVHCVQLLHTILHRTDLIIFPLALQTITIAPMMCIWGRGKGHTIYIWSSWYCCHPVISCFIIENGLTFLVPAYPGCCWKGATKWVSVCAHYHYKCTYIGM